MSKLSRKEVAKREKKTHRVRTSDTAISLQQNQIEIACQVLEIFISILIAVKLRIKVNNYPLSEWTLLVREIREAAQRLRIVADNLESMLEPKKQTRQEP